MTSDARNAAHRRAWLMALAATAVLYALTFNNHWAIERDSATYLEIGQSLAEGRGMQFNGHAAWGLPPLVPGLVAGCHLVTGPDLWPINLLMKLFAVGAVALGYLVVRRLATDLPEPIREGLAFATILVVGTSARLLRESAPVLTDVPFLFWATLALYLFLRGRQGHWAWCLAGGLVMLAACATRYVGVVLYGGMVLALAMDVRQPGGVRRLAAGLAPAALAGLGGVAVYAVFLRSAPVGGLLATLASVPREEWNMLVQGEKWMALARALGAVPSAAFETLVDQSLVGVGAAAFAVMAVGWAAAWRRREWLVTVPLAAYAAFLVLLGRDAVAPRYLVPFLPVLAYLLLRGTYAVALWVQSHWPRGADGTPGRPVRLALIGLVALCMAISLPKDVRQVYWMRHDPFYDLYEKGRWVKWVDLAAYLRAQGRPGIDQVGTAEIAVVHYLSGLTVRTESFQSGQGSDCPRFLLSSPASFPPKVFGPLMAASGLRFVVVPLNVTVAGEIAVAHKASDFGDWSAAAVRSMEATGAFLSPPRRFGNLMLYERKDSAARLTSAHSSLTLSGAP